MIDEITERKIVRDYKRGMTVQEICNLHSLTFYGLDKILKPYFESGEIERRSKIAGKSCPRRITPELEQQIAYEYYELRTKAKDIMQKYTVHPPQMQRIIRKFSAQYPNRKYTKFTYEQYEQLAKEYFENGLTAKELKDKFDVNASNLKIMCKLFRHKYGKKSTGKKKSVK